MPECNPTPTQTQTNPCQCMGFLLPKILMPIGYLKIWLVQGSLSTGKRASQPKNGFTVHRKMDKNTVKPLY
ncbi:hypothetical protein E6P75_11830 [Moraxella osloensis]|uniref:Transposase n=1 Tax=Faucicola osloensis TaxID=34062 RepID=A0AAW6TL94_FAUOS|nr:hypothetical protein [Moraxella osloensis]MDI4510884.1 hypothetical protein [Moraxella osloensis]